MLPRPYVFVNMAMTADGKIDTVERQGARISGAADTARVDRLRADQTPFGGVDGRIPPLDPDGGLGGAVGTVVIPTGPDPDGFGPLQPEFAWI